MQLVEALKIYMFCKLNHYSIALLKLKIHETIFWGEAKNHAAGKIIIAEHELTQEGI